MAPGNRFARLRRRPAPRLAWAALCALLAGCAQSAAPPAGIAFTDVTAEAGLSDFRHIDGAQGKRWLPETMGAGCAFIDYDGDGRQDILLVGGGEWSPESATPALWLYRNNGDGTFTRRTEEAGLGGVRAYGFGLTVADYDADGDADFYFTTLRGNRLFRNDGGRFADVTAAAGVAGYGLWSTAAVFFDADGDGPLDLYVANYVEWTPETDLFCTLDGVNKTYCTPEAFVGAPGWFFHNNGDGAFTDRTEAAGLGGSPGKSLGTALSDFNEDGRPDLIVANDTQRNLLYVNQGGGRFREMGVASGLAYDENGKARAGMGIDAGVLDSTGRETIVIANFANEMIGLYRYVGNDMFVDRARESKLGHASLTALTFAILLFDADLDGDLDVLAANGHIDDDIEKVSDTVTYREAAQLFLNDHGRFTEVGKTAGGAFERHLVARGAAYADYDGDGDLDVLLTENKGGAYLWRNDSPARGWLRVSLRAEGANRDAIGARIEAQAGGKKLVQRVRTGSSYLSSSELVATFGLGAAGAVDSLVVRWPSGGVTRLGRVEGNRHIRVHEQGGRIEAVGPARAASHARQGATP